MKQLKEGMRVILSMEVDLGDGEYDEEIDEWIVEPATQIFHLRGWIIRYIPNPRPGWWNDDDCFRFVADARLPKILFDLGHAQPTPKEPWFVNPDDCKEVKTFRDWVRGLK